jgi:hypothetical protein
MEKFNLVRHYEVRIPSPAFVELRALEAAGTIPDTWRSDLFHAIIDETAAGDCEALYLCKSPTFGKGTWMTHKWGGKHVKAAEDAGDERFKILYKLEDYGCSEKSTEEVTT